MMSSSGPPSLIHLLIARCKKSLRDILFHHLTIDFLLERSNLISNFGSFFELLHGNSLLQFLAKPIEIYSPFHLLSRTNWHFSGMIRTALDSSEQRIQPWSKVLIAIRATKPSKLRELRIC